MSERVTKQMKRGDNSLPWGVQLGTPVVVTDGSSDDSFATHITLCSSADPKDVLVGVRFLRKQMSMESNPPTELVVNSGVIPLLVKCMQNYDYPEIQFEASWTLSNVAFGSSEGVTAVVHANVVVVWVEHLGSPVSEVVEQALWGIGNVVGEGRQYRDFCLHAGALRGIMGVLAGPMAEENVSVARNGVWAMSNFCRYKHLPQELLAPIVEAATHFALYADAVSLDAMWTLNYISEQEDHEEGPQHILKKRALSTVMNSVGAILERNPLCRVPLLRTLGNLSAGHATLAVATAPGVLQFLHTALMNSDNFFGDDDRREAMWSVSNLAADSGKDGEKCIHLLLEGGFTPLIISALGEFTSNYPVAKQALYAVTNILAGGTDNQKTLLIEMGVVPFLVQWLRHCREPQMISTCLDGVRNVLQCDFGPSCVSLFEEHGLLEILHSLCSSTDENLAAVATLIGNSYFSRSSQV